MAYELIEVRTEGGKVGIITLNRPKQLNALNSQLMVELGQALKAFDADDAIEEAANMSISLAAFRTGCRCPAPRRSRGSAAPANGTADAAGKTPPARSGRKAGIPPGWTCRSGSNDVA